MQQYASAGAGAAAAMVHHGVLSCLRQVAEALRQRCGVGDVAEPGEPPGRRDAAARVQELLVMTQGVLDTLSRQGCESAALGAELRQRSEAGMRCEGGFGDGTLAGGVVTAESLSSSLARVHIGETITP